MANVKPKIRTKGTGVKIYIRFVDGRKHDYTLRTDFVINSKDWNEEKNRPKPNSPDNKILKNTLDVICHRIIEYLNELTQKGLEPSKEWFENTYNSILNKEAKEQNAEIEYWIEYIINNAHQFENSIGTKGLSKNRVKHYKTLLNTFKEYQGKHKYKIVEVNQLFYDNFFHWLKNYCLYSHNTCKKYTDDLVSVARHSRRFNIPTSQDIDYIKKVRVQPTSTIVLEEIEIEKIQNVQLKNSKLLNARKWLLLGIEVAQRVSDLLRLDERNIEYVKNLDGIPVKCLVFKQKKSQYTKEMTISIEKNIESIIKNGLPHQISEQRFNEYIKEVAQLAGLNTPTKGVKIQVIEINGKKKKRGIAGTYEKWELITSHVMRKTATTHMYHVFGSQVKHITGHSKEETVNTYVNTDRARKVSQVQKLQREYNKHRDQGTYIGNLKIVKNVSNQE